MFVSIIIQQDATIYSLFISANCCTCFGWYLHPSSGGHITVSTVSGIAETVIVTCRERDWTGSHRVIWAPDDGWRYHPKHVQQFADINKLYIVASCWIIIDTYYVIHGPLNIKCVAVLMEIKRSSLLSGSILNQLNPIKFWEVNFSNCYSLTYTCFLFFIWLHNCDITFLNFSLVCTYGLIYPVSFLHEEADLTHSTQFA